MARRLTIGLGLALACCVMVAGWVWLRRAPVQPEIAQPARRGSGERRTRPAVQPPSALSSSAGYPLPDASTDLGISPAVACEPRATKACHRGDVHWFDSCGRATELIEACAGRLCFDIACAP